jgi:hypothetical protein
LSTNIATIILQKLLETIIAFRFSAHFGLFYYQFDHGLMDHHAVRRRNSKCKNTVDECTATRNALEKGAAKSGAFSTLAF